MNEHYKQHEEWLRKHSKEAQVMLEVQDGLVIGALYLSVDPKCPAALVDIYSEHIIRKAHELIRLEKAT